MKRSELTGERWSFVPSRKDWDRPEHCQSLDDRLERREEAARRVRARIGGDQ